MSEDKTPQELLEEEVIRSSRPKRISFWDVDGELHLVRILPLSMDDLTSVTNIIVQVVNKAIDFGTAYDLRFADAARSVGSAAQGKNSEPAPSERLLQEAAIEVVKQSDGVLKWLIEHATDAKWETVKGDYLALLELALKCIEHNTGPRLAHFFGVKARSVLQDLGLEIVRGQGKTDPSDSIGLKPSLPESVISDLTSSFGLSGSTS